MARRTDSNQAAIVTTLRELHCHVIDLHSVGRGCPDLHVSLPNGQTFLAEIKTSAGTLNEAQIAFQRTYPGKVYVIRTVDQAIGIVMDLMGGTDAGR